jgi:predicted metal-dependent HD superfamily phosphohydrolase
MFAFTLSDVIHSRSIPLMKRPFEWQQLSPIYQDPRRAYHDIRHIQTLMREVLCLNIPEDMKLWLEAIAWTHDAYYDPLLGSPGNEDFSARLLNTSLGASFTQDGLDLAFATIALTAEHNITHPTIDPLSALFLDIDISHLGAAYPVFVRNCQLISEEYRHCGVADNVLIEGYHKFFEGMLSRSRLYYTQMYEHLEGVARENLTKGLTESAVLVAPPQLVIFEHPSDAE